MIVDKSSDSTVVANYSWNSFKISLSSKIKTIWENTKLFFQTWVNDGKWGLVFFSASVVSIPILGVFMPLGIIPVAVILSALALKNLKATICVKTREKTMLEMRDTMLAFVEDLLKYDPRLQLDELQERRNELIKEVNESSLREKDSIIDQLGRLEIGTITASEFVGFIYTIESQEKDCDSIAFSDRTGGRLNHDAARKQFEEEKAPIYKKIENFFRYIKRYKELKNFPVLRAKLDSFSKWVGYSSTQMTCIQTFSEVLDDIIQKRAEALKAEVIWKDFLENDDFKKSLKSRINAAYESRNLMQNQNAPL